MVEIGQSSAAAWTKQAYLAVSEEVKRFAEDLTNNKQNCLNAIDAKDPTYPELEEHLAYGTAGFRGRVDQMHKVCFRIALVVAMRAKTKGTIGIMVTGSATKYTENGVKIIDVGGGFLPHDWELIADTIVNSCDIRFSMKNLNEIAVRGFPDVVDFFGVTAIPEPGPKA